MSHTYTYEYLGVLGIQGLRIYNFKVNGKIYYFVLCLRYIKSRLTVFGLKTKCLKLSLELSAFVVLSIKETDYPCIKTLKDDDSTNYLGYIRGNIKKKF